MPDTPSATRSSVDFRTVIPASVFSDVTVHVFMDRGAYRNIVGDVGGTSCVDTGGADDTHHSSVWIANRPGQTNAPPHDNQVLGLAQSGQLHDPRYSVYFGAGTTRNTVRGTAAFSTIAKVFDQGYGNTAALE